MHRAAYPDEEVEARVRPKRLLAFDALDRALKRAAEVELADEEAYAPISESLWWIDYLSESFRRQDAGYAEKIRTTEAGRVINGLEYARNRHAHNPSLKSMHWPDQGFEQAGGRWRWRRLEDIPPDERDDRAGRTDYAELLEGKNVFEAFEVAHAFLLDWYDSLDYKGDD